MFDNLGANIWDGACSIVIFFVSLFVRSHNERLKDMEAAQRSTDRELQAHKLHVLESFETKDSSHASIILIRQAVDDVRSVMASGMSEVRTDIKEILKRLPK